MTISIWRYSHLALAVSSFIFIVIASVTGIILATQPISEQIQPYKVDGFEDIRLSETLKVFNQQYSEILNIDVDANSFVTASVFTKDGEDLQGYFNPATAEYLGAKPEPSPFFKWVTNLHRSLFLKGLGRFFVGLASFLLFLIAISGSILILKRQGSIKQFFSRIVKEDFYQYAHVALGRLTLIPILIITLTGVYLSLLRFDILPKDNTSHDIDYETLSETPLKDVADFSIFQNTSLSDVKTIEFPFSDDIEDFYTLTLKDKELIVNQFDGSIISTKTFPWVTVYSDLSLLLHTGKGSIIWSIILGLASINILFFVYSGFIMTFKRRAFRLKNKYTKDNCEYIVLVGSENGTTIAFANAFYKQLIASGHRVYISELNKFSTYKKAQHIIAFTATYGQGEAPANADTFITHLQSSSDLKDIKYSVVGFGSLAYPDFCKFAFDVDSAFSQTGMQALLDIFTINDKNLESFQQWVSLWSKASGIEVSVAEEHIVLGPKNTKTFKVLDTTEVSSNPDNTFLIKLKPSRKQPFSSGDLLAIYPENDHRERLYSIGKVNGELQLSIKYHDLGIGSNFLKNLKANDTLKARIIKNASFHIPKQAKNVILIANGTGIAPFLGMLDENRKYTPTEAYFGLKNTKSLELYKPVLEPCLNDCKLMQLHLAYSQEGKKTYVQDLIRRDAEKIAKTLEDNGIIMICGSMAMYTEVMDTLNECCTTFNKKPISHYKSQIKSDCY